MSLHRSELSDPPALDCLDDSKLSTSASAMLQFSKTFPAPGISCIPAKEAIHNVITPEPMHSCHQSSCRAYKLVLQLLIAPSLNGRIPFGVGNGNEIVKSDG